MAATDTSKYVFNHSMIRVKDPKRSVAFYELLGMSLINKMEAPEAKFDLYFLAYERPASSSSTPKPHQSARQGILELTHNYGTESDAEYKVNTGNSDPGKGFGHTCVSVDNIQAACHRLEEAGVKFQKRLTDGRMKHIAFALDPDGYWVELIGQKDTKDTEGVTTTDISTYTFNHTMIRVKDPEASLKFYQDVLGMTLIRTAENKDAGFNLYFLCYPDYDGRDTAQAKREGILELTWNYGTEKDADFHYHNGNDKPLQGFGHTCVAVDDLEAACARFERLGVTFQKRLTDGRMKHIAFIRDPDDYWIEIIQNQDIKKGEGWD